MDYENFVFCSCTNIRMLRLLHDLTQAEVAGMIGMGRSSYSAVETEKQIMSFYTACRISEIYDIDVSSLISEDLFGQASKRLR